MLEWGSLGEFFIIVVAALILIGPKEMPNVLRNLGRWSQKIHLLSASLRQSLDQYIQEGKFEEYQKTTNDSIIKQAQDLEESERMSSSSPKRKHGNF